MKDITQWLFAHQDLPYKEFQGSLIPNIDPDRIIGVRTPQLRMYAKELMRDGRAEVFIQELPHKYFEENQLHAFILSANKEYEILMTETERFLPYIDNWATCDQFRPGIFQKHTDLLQDKVKQWLRAEHPYIVRFGLGMLNSYYLDEYFEPKYLEWAVQVHSDAYYVNMMLAWYLATALTKQYKSTLPLFLENRLDAWVHNKAIQKARESRRVPDDIKKYLKTLRH